MTAPYSISLEPELAEHDKRSLLDKLVAFGDRFVPPRNYTPLIVTVRDPDGCLCGGLLGSTLWDWLQIEVLWINESIQRRGLGSQLLRVAEGHAVSIGCQFSRVDTFDFEARAFYEHHNYAVYGELPDFPAGHTQFHLRKSLAG